MFKRIFFAGLFSLGITIPALTPVNANAQIEEVPEVCEQPTKLARNAINSEKLAEREAMIEAMIEQQLRESVLNARMAMPNCDFDEEADFYEIHFDKSWRVSGEHIEIYDECGNFIDSAGEHSGVRIWFSEGRDGIREGCDRGREFYYYSHGIVDGDDDWVSIPLSDKDQIQTKKKRGQKIVTVDTRNARFGVVTIVHTKEFRGHEVRVEETIETDIDFLIPSDGKGEFSKRSSKYTFTPQNTEGTTSGGGGGGGSK